MWNLIIPYRHAREVISGPISTFWLHQFSLGVSWGCWTAAASPEAHSSLAGKWRPWQTCVVLNSDVGSQSAKHREVCSFKLFDSAHKLVGTLQRWQLQIPPHGALRDIITKSQYRKPGELASVVSTQETEQAWQVRQFMRQRVIIGS